MSISTVLTDEQVWLRLVGGIFLCYLGLRTFIAKPAERAPSIRSESLVGAYFSTLALTLANPVTMLAFAAVFGGRGVPIADYAGAGLLVLGVIAGSVLWWLALSGGVGAFRASFYPSRLRWVNRISRAIIVGFGLLAVSSLIL